MNYLDFPPFPAMGEKGPQVCESVRFYLAIIDDLPFEQVRVLSAHIQECASCAAEFRLLQRVTGMVAALPESAPSTRTNEAILAALRKQQRIAGSSARSHTERQPRDTPESFPAARRTITSRRRVGTLALVAALLLVLALGGVFLRGIIFPPNNSWAFQLPANLSWSGYVLHYTETRADARGKLYQVEVYQDLGTEQMHIESSMPGEFDVVVITDNQTMLGKDMMHHVAQMGNAVENWAVDGSLFDLTQLRQDLANHSAVYLGKASFQGQEVYRIRASNGQVLLLNRQYLPVSVLRDVTGPGTGVPVYKTFALMTSTQVADSMWDMQIPPGFQMGQLPANS